MSRTSIAVLVALFFVVGFGVAELRAETPPPVAAPTVRWDHQCDDVPLGEFTFTGKRRGEDGWELVSMVNVEKLKSASIQTYPYNVEVHTIMCFKRPKR